MGCNIYIRDYKATKVLQFPTIPEQLPSIYSSSKNEEFETYWDLPYNFIEKPGLIQLSWDSWLPANASKYNFCKSKVNAKEIIDLIENAKKNTEPVIVTILVDGQFYVNETFSIEKFEYNIIKRGDYKYSLELKQWRDYTTILSKKYNVGWEQNSVGWYYYTDTSGSYYKDSWQLIDNEWYSFDPQGYARQSAWIEDGGYWYYLKDSCKMARNEWLELDNKWYYFGDRGGMYSNCYTPDGYWVNSDGVWIK